MTIACNRLLMWCYATVICLKQSFGCGGVLQKVSRRICTGPQVLELSFGSWAWHCVPLLLSEYGQMFWGAFSGCCTIRVNVDDFRFLACFVLSCPWKSTPGTRVHRNLILGFEGSAYFFAYRAYNCAVPEGISGGIGPFISSLQF